MDNERNDTITLPDGSVHPINEEIPIPDEAPVAFSEVELPLAEDVLNLDGLNYGLDEAAEILFPTDDVASFGLGEEKDPEPTPPAPEPPAEREREPFRLRIPISDDVLDEIIRITGGLILLTLSGMFFMPRIVSLILGLGAVALCGLPVFWMAAFRLKDRKIFSEELIISLAAIFAAVSGYAWDGVLALIVADVGFALRDNFLGDRREEAEEALGQSSAEDPMLKPHWVNLLETLFTPVALLLFLLALILSLVLGKAEAGLWIHRSLILLIAASPLVTTVILALTCDFGKLAARDRGVAFSGCRSIRTAAALTSLVFNKTGTITEGNYRVSGLYPVRITEQQLLYLAAYAEASSEHPLAKAITAAAGVKVDTAQIARSRMEPGMGAIVQLKNGQILTAGSIELMDKLGLAEEAVPGLGVAVYVAVGKTFVGRIDLEDTIRPGARETVEQLRKQGVVNVALMTGDNSISASAIGKEVGISEIYADYLPKDKIDRISAIVKAQKKNERLAYVTGAGSDIPAQRLADLGIILGEGEGATGTRVNIPSGELTALPNVVRCAKRVRTASLCAVILLLVAKLVSVVLGLLGLFPLFCAVLLDIAAALLCGVLAKNLKNEV